VPKGDVLHQFRQDVKNGQLPTVSWLVAPESFSDHPSSAWYGAWYISETMDILTQNPEVWKKTIFILTYDENDGYFDHVPPFVAPHPGKPGTGKVSDPIDTTPEYVSSPGEQSNKALARESAIGLGYRVPLVIASPWSRGGYVCSEVYDHTSSLQFLEKFLSHKTGKKIAEPNISAWRRAVCGDLTAAFRPYNGEPVTTPAPLGRDAFVEGIHKAKFKQPPSNFKPLTPAEIAAINQRQPSPYMPVQEKGIRPSNALHYELYAESRLSPDKQSVTIILKASTDLFGADALGAPFHIYAPGIYKGEKAGSRSYAVTPGNALKDSWTLSDFENGQYHLRVYGPNGFFREFKGSANDPAIDINCNYERSSAGKLSFTGNVLVNSRPAGTGSFDISITDNAYKAAPLSDAINAQHTVSSLLLDGSKSHGWYDFTVRIKGATLFERRYAGRVETGKDSMSDPVMGQMV
jgi:phospholipase C